MSRTVRVAALVVVAAQWLVWASSAAGRSERQGAAKPWRLATDDTEIVFTGITGGDFGRLRLGLGRSIV